MHAGSSPLARGLLRVADLQWPLPRIIPARAGFTDGRDKVQTGLLGSSPLARGLLSVAMSMGPSRVGFISVRSCGH